MRSFIYIIGVIILLAACSKSGEDKLAEIQEQAGNTAKEYYNLLLSEKYDDFVSGMDGGDSLPPTYREQMVANAAMFMKQQQDDHKGIKSIEFNRCKADTALHTAEAMLTFNYADATQETVCVPMVEHNGVWYMK